MDIKKYHALIFDCDGVILNSNKIKTDAFYSVAKLYGEKAAKELVKYHVCYGGISRYHKFEYFLKAILGKKIQQDELDLLLDKFAKEVKKGLLECEITDGLEELRQKTSKCKWFLVSGGKQEELREIFRVRRIEKYFDGGIFGSPDTKEEILQREINNGNIIKPAVFFGDTKLDYEIATKFGIDFIFIYGWTEFKNWQKYFSGKQVEKLKYIASLQA